MAEPYHDRHAAAGFATRAELDEGLRRHVLSVYDHMALGLVLTGVVAYLVGTTPALHGPLFGTPLKWAVMLAPLGFVFLLPLRADTISTGAARALFWAFCAVMGLSLASVFLVFAGASVARVFFVAAGMFGAASLFGHATTADLTRAASFLFMGLIGVVIAGLANLFVGSSALRFAISVIGVIVFTGLAAYDTRAIKEAYAEGAGAEANDKLAVLGALSLYLSFVNLFRMLLHLLGRREERGRRDRVRVVAAEDAAGRRGTRT